MLEPAAVAHAATLNRRQIGGDRHVDGVDPGVRVLDIDAAATHRLVARDGDVLHGQAHRVSLDAAARARLVLGDRAVRDPQLTGQGVDPAAETLRLVVRDLNAVQRYLHVCTVGADVKARAVLIKTQ